MWISEQSSILGRGTRFSHSMDSVVPVQNKISQVRKEVHESFSSRLKIRKSLKLTVPLEFGKACDDLSWNHRTSTPRRIAEGAVRRVKEGTSAVLLQSGLDEKWWADSMECFVYLRNIQDLLSDEKTPYERLLGEPFFFLRTNYSIWLIG